MKRLTDAELQMIQIKAATQSLICFFLPSLSHFIFPLLFLIVSEQIFLMIKLDPLSLSRQSAEKKGKNMCGACAPGLVNVAHCHH